MIALGQRGTLLAKLTNPIAHAACMIWLTFGHGSGWKLA